MRRLLLVLVVLLVVASGAFAQYNFDQLKTDFGAFAGAVANALPFNASIGNNWSDAYIGQLVGLPPHFGVGVSAGATSIPFSSVESLMTSLGVPLPSGIDQLKAWGVGFPIPAYTADVRIGGFILPFDIGLKVGYLPPDALAGLPFTADYLLAGADVRFAVMQENVLLPDISAGVGYTFMHGRIGIAGVLPGNITVANFTFPDSSTHTLQFSNPSVNFAWDTSVIDLKVQVSKSLLIITPYLGAGAALGISGAGGGFASSMLVDGSPVTQAQLDQINQATGGSYTLQNPGFSVLSTQYGWSVRAWGGLSLNILVLMIDMNAMYNFTSGSLGASVGARIQI